MATRLHKLIAALDKTKDPLFDDHKQLVAVFAQHAVQFDFGDEDKAAPPGTRQPLLDYSFDLAKNGLFNLPYPATYICTSNIIKTGPAKGLRADDCYLFSQIEDDKIVGVQFGIHPKYDFITYVFAVDIRIRDMATKIISGIKVNVDEGLNNIYYTQSDIQEKDESRVWVAQSLMVFIALLNSKSVEIKTVASSGSVNRRRAREGKPPIGEVHEVHIKLNGQRYSMDGNPIGSGSSKRAHWRRGHIRRLASGEITNVRPCLVAYTGNENVPEQVYKVTA
jgi:hypothetical protein